MNFIRPVRAIIIGILCVIFTSIAIPYCDLIIKGTWPGLFAFPIASFLVLFVFTLGLNPLLKWMKLGLKSSEVLLIYCMLLVGVGIPSLGLTGLLIQMITGPFYYATPENRYAEILHPYLPQWMAPKDQMAIKYLYEGLPKGMAIPWAVWIKPLFYWTLLALAIYLVMFCLSVIMRKQWVENEKLVFPLVYLPIEMAKENSSQSFIPSFFKNKLMWVFFAVPMLIHTINGLHFYFPMIPYINIYRFVLHTYFVDKPWNAIAPFWLFTSFSIIGLSYLLPTQLSFSLWFFYFFFLIQAVIGSSLGFPMPWVPGYPVRSFIANEMTGGIVIFIILGLWTMRKILKDIFLKAFTNNPRINDSNEPFSYRLAVFGLIGGLICIGFWGKLAGASFWATLTIFGVYFLFMIATTRLICEGGVLFVQNPLPPLNIMITSIGSSALGPANLAILGLFNYLFMFDSRTPVMPSIMQAFKISDSTDFKRKDFFLGMVIAIPLAILISYYAFLTFMYRIGGVNVHPWFSLHFTHERYGPWISHLITKGESNSIHSLLTMVVGGAVMWFLVFMHHRFLWWPLHPFGFLMGASPPMINFWFPIFIGWLIKLFVIKFGGIKIYRKLMPGFLGLIMGEFLGAGIWLIIDFFTGVRGHIIFSF